MSSSQHALTHRRKNPYTFKKTKTTQQHTEYKLLDIGNTRKGEAAVKTYLSMSWRRWRRRRKKDSGFPDTKAVSFPFPPFPCPFRRNLPTISTKKNREKKVLVLSLSVLGSVVVESVGRLDADSVSWLGLPVCCAAGTLCSSFSGSLSRNMC